MKIATLTLMLAALAVMSVTLALISGAYHLDLAQVIALIAQPDTLSPEDRIVFWQIRLPRILAALLLGAALAGAGTTYQGMFRNPLVSPDILGVSAGAGLGACTAILLGLPMVLIQLYAFCGGLLVVAGVWLITRRVRRHDPVLTLVLVGIALSTLCGAGISLIKILADPYTQLPSITFWLLGGLSSVTLRDLSVAAPVILTGIVPLLLLRWRMNLLTLSDDEARSLGINVARLRLGLIVCATLITASTVAIAGIIGWIGLVVPHIGRLLTGNNHQQLLPVAMGIGAILLLVTDTLARAASSTEIPLGILTAFVGAPFFLLLLLRGGSR
ncbi:Probable ABC transporter permease protein HI_1471 [Yokenella regensburgei]|uniref:Probable ABC transporter permease protein HI_1471 n=3 Tax=Yokenella regensburgei TaxID=158877 RepID=A0AB38FW37_9ENTR|nr:iron ABC transporter permease [Yokenella regensburgei]SQA62927.1 Probable ABC transporter permease protein HI_1471 [Yokenella regensburgei]SQB02170.1 Probable ABC transporter permease protein HI_1471 [Yokenella regensburgei]SUQ07528.1 Probable ABC transporter permease protein HI_1471 [Yokenella regensburgei]